MPASEEPPKPGAIEAEPARLEMPVGCSDPIAVYGAGKKTKLVCADEAARSGLTVIDLSDAWAPAPFAEAPDLGKAGRQPYRNTMLAIADEHFGKGPDWDRARDDRYFELYGIFPTLRVIRERMNDEERYRCHDAVDDAALERLDKPLDAWRDRDAQRSDKAYAKNMWRVLESERQRRDLPSIDALKDEPKFALSYERYAQRWAPVAAVMAVQAHLRCDDLLSRKAEDGIFDYPTVRALETYRRKHMIVSWTLDDETRSALLADQRELDFKGALRVLRERVIDATGIIEDGSARGEWGLVAGRMLEAEAFRAVARSGTLENGAPDLVSAATDAAARALGWTSPEAAKASLDALGAEGTRTFKVAVALPPLPKYYAEHMELRAEIDRGDVWYDFPFTAKGEPKGQAVNRRPTLVLYAKDGDHEVALVRWPTTIGGWKAERLGPRRLGMVYKESPAGPRVWKDLIVGPIWIPPESAPKKEIVRATSQGGYALRTDLFGPGYASAFGLLKLEHERVAKMANAKEPVYFDEGVGTHGSVSYDSIHRGTSHGCHRLHNHMAIRLGAFLLKHRHHERKGVKEVGYGRILQYEGKRLTLKFDDGGYIYELTPPVQVEVLKGRIMSSAVAAPTSPHPLPEKMLAQFTQERFED